MAGESGATSIPALRPQFSQEIIAASGLPESFETMGTHKLPTYLTRVLAFAQLVELPEQRRQKRLDEPSVD
jgi:hypothetical protein